MTRKLWFLVAGCLLSVSLVLAACGDDDDDGSGDDNAEVQAFFDQLVADFNAGDAEVFAANFDDESLIAFIGEDEVTTREAATEAIAGRMESIQVELLAVKDVAQSGDDTTAGIELAVQGTVAAESYVLTPEGDGFLITGYEQTNPDIPDGVTPFEVTGQDFEYVFEGGDAEGGVEAIVFTNEGEQFHEIALLKAAEDAPELDTIIEDALGAEGPEDLPDSIEAFVAVAFAAPGESTNMVLVDPLESGRYVMVCFIPDETQGEERPPHAALGMAAEFTVE